MKEMRNTYNILIIKPEGHRWEDCIKMDVIKSRMEGYILDSSGSGYCAVAGPCEHDNEMSINSGNIYFTV
jgi:hypothetical protein